MDRIRVSETRDTGSTPVGATQNLTRIRKVEEKSNSDAASLILRVYYFFTFTFAPETKQL